MLEQLQVFEDYEQSGDLKYSKTVFKAALRYYVRINDVRAEMSVYPRMAFTQKSTGDRIYEHADEIVAAYKEHQREERRLKARSRK